MAYPHKWSAISYKSSAGQRKHIGQIPMLYRWTTPPTRRLKLENVKPEMNENNDEFTDRKSDALPL